MPNEVTDAAARSAKASKTLGTMRARIVKADEARTEAAHQARAGAEQAERTLQIAFGKPMLGLDSVR